MPPPDSRQAAAKNASKAPAPVNGSSEAVLQECEALEAELAWLRNAYEQYFLGLERQAPTRAHDDFKKRVNKLKTAFIRSTSAKFRVASIHSKYLTYERLWVRTIQEIEAGTYRRDLFKARRRAESRKGPASASTAQKGVVELPEDISEMEFEEVAEVRPVNEPPLATGKASATPAPVPPPSTMSVTPAVGGTPFKGTPAVAPVVPPVGGTPLKGTPAVAPVVPPLTPAIPAVAPAIPVVAPLAGTPARGLPTLTPPMAGTPARGTPTPPGLAAKTPSGATPSVGVPARPPAAAPGGAVARPPSPTAAPPRPPAPGGSAGMSDDKLRAVYDAYVTAKRRCQEDTSKLSYESVAATLRKQVPELLKQHNAKAVEFKVVIKDGKASLKAVPK
ncbi:MAG TPA: MXAN_5187 C-terminal domain-containing protein [Myxococcus sp.]|nr:MXAN_5187 C-terminal domain-containing protein [Myxococcus sp.]